MRYSILMNHAIGEGRAQGDNIHASVKTDLSTVHPTPNNLNHTPTPSTLHPPPYTLHPPPSTLHPTP
jgi:hypothetical protein